MHDGAGGAGAFLGVERSVCGRRWRLRAGDAVEGQVIAERLALPEILGRLLALRGIARDHAPGFLAPRLRDQLPDPTHLLDMEAAAARLVRAVRSAANRRGRAGQRANGAKLCLRVKSWRAST